MTNQSTPSTSPIIVWFRADLRIHDHPALASALTQTETIIPVFILDDAILKGTFHSSNRNRFLLECLEDLKASLKEVGADLVVRHGTAVDELRKLAHEHHSHAVYYTADYSPLSLNRDRHVETSLKEEGIEARGFGGKLAVSSLQKLVTKSGTPYKVFTPFWKSWQNVERRPTVAAPKKITLPAGIVIGSLPSSSQLVKKDELSPHVVKGGETAARQRLHDFLDSDIHDYADSNNDMGKDRTSRLSPYLHFGCISVREIETLLPESKGASSWHRQLAWRDFYYYVLFHFPHPEKEFQERYRTLQWTSTPRLLEAWKQGRTGYPLVDAAMRQLQQEGWMHNRARLIVGSFLTKDIGADWREGELHFMQWLLDGDMANNNGNWQWIASVGVDPAPVFRRLYNPSSQRDRFDPEGIYVRKYVPELKKVPDAYISEPWNMPPLEQQLAGCIIGEDYPEPIVNHKEARLAALERYRSTT